jgi:hypothetical protein
MWPRRFAEILPVNDRTFPVARSCMPCVLLACLARRRHPPTHSGRLRHSCHGLVFRPSNLRGAPIRSRQLIRGHHFHSILT